MTEPVERCQDVLKRLQALHPKVIDLSLGRMQALLDKLDNPERSLPPIVHVAGTNGKGSLVAYLKSIFQASGYKAHTYISPHLVRFNERIVLGGNQITDDALAAVLERVETANAGAPITFFEITTAAAFVAFSQYPADVLLLEVGLGGRLDATNVIPPPLLTAITPISLDHQYYLGDTLAAIAGEKAGIIKEGCTAIVGPQPPEALSVIDLRAASVGATALACGREWTAGACPEGLKYQDAIGTLLLPKPGLFGAHQIANAGTAVACALQLRKRFQKITAVSLAQGLRKVEHPARMQRLITGPLVDLLPDTCELWLDGGHNPGAGEALAETLKEWRDRPLFLIVGMIDSKDPRGFLSPLQPFAKTIRTVTIPDEANSVAGDRLAAIAQDVGFADAASVDAVSEGLREIADRALGARVLICGSLYLAGRVLAENRCPPPIS